VILELICVIFYEERTCVGLDRSHRRWQQRIVSSSGKIGSRYRMLFARKTGGPLNRLKMLKRQMCGRAGIELLRARLLPEPALMDP
jgi:hypothetical protein